MKLAQLIGLFDKSDFDDRVNEIEKSFYGTNVDSDMARNFRDANNLRWYQTIAFNIFGAYQSRAAVVEASERILKKYREQQTQPPPSK